MSGNDRLHLGDRGRTGSSSRGVHGVENLERESTIDRALGEGVEGHDPDERSLEGANVVGDAVGDEVEHGGIGERDVVQRHPLTQDGHAGGVVGRLDVGDEAGLEALPEPLLDRDECPREAITGERGLPGRFS